MIYIHKPCPTCKKNARYAAFSSHRSCLDCQRHYASTQLSQKEEEILDEMDAKEERRRIKAAEKRLARDQGEMDL